MVWRRIAEKRFRSEESRAEFLDEIEEPAPGHREFDGAFWQSVRRRPARSPSLCNWPCKIAKAGYEPVRRLVTIRLQRDVLGLNYRLQWVGHCIKVTSMLGLFGTVIGMMGTFGKLASLEQVSPRPPRTSALRW